MLPLRGETAESIASKSSPHKDGRRTANFGDPSGEHPLASRTKAQGGRSPPKVVTITPPVPAELALPPNATSSVSYTKSGAENV